MTYTWQMELEDKGNLRARLREEAIDNAERDIAISEEWFPLEEEAARHLGATSPNSSPDSLP
jgi:hypothetical protein